MDYLADLQAISNYLWKLLCPKTEHHYWFLCYCKWEQPIATRETYLWGVLLSRVGDKDQDHYDACSIASSAFDLTAFIPWTAECMNLWPSASRGLIPLRLYSLLSQVGSSCAFGSQKLPGVPSVASSKRQPETATVWVQHHVNMAWMVTTSMKTIIIDLLGNIIWSPSNWSSRCKQTFCDLYELVSHNHSS